MSTTSFTPPADIVALLKANQFTVETSHKSSRYYWFKGMMPAYPYPVFLKINRGQTNALLQKNHVLWTKSLQAALPPDAPFGIAPILNEGTAGNHYWFLSRFIEGTPFSVEEKGITAIQPANPESYFGKIVALMRFIEKTPVKSLHGVDLRLSGVGRFDKLRLITDMISWAREYTPHLAELLQLVSKNYDRLQIAPGHGDFKDTNLIIDTTGKPIIVDAEWGSARHYKYGDAVEFYNRLYTLACRPELAKGFLHIYTATLHKSELPRFATAFLCLSAQRGIGNFAEIETYVSGDEKAKRQAFARQYIEDILSYAIIDEIQ